MFHQSLPSTGPVLGNLGHAGRRTMVVQCNRLDEKGVPAHLRTEGCTSLESNIGAVHRKLVVLVHRIGLLVVARVVEGARALVGRIVDDREEVGKMERAGLAVLHKTGHAASGQG